MKTTLSLSLDEVVRGGENLYREVRKELESEYRGMYVVFDVEKKEKFIDADKYAAIEKAKKSQGPKVFFIVEIGNFHPTTL